MIAWDVFVDLVWLVVGGFALAKLSSIELSLAATAIGVTPRAIQKGRQLTDEVGQVHMGPAQRDRGRPWPNPTRPDRRRM